MNESECKNAQIFYVADITFNMLHLHLEIISSTPPLVADKTQPSQKLSMQHIYSGLRE